jgi:hypothetical protein
MSIKKIFILLFFLFSKASAFAQNDQIKNVKKAVSGIVAENMIVEKIKDSTAVYSFFITISVTKLKGKRIVKSEINNNEVALFFKGLDLLKKIDYTSLLKKKKEAKFSFNGYILVHDSKYDQDLIEISTLPKALKHLFLNDESNLENLGSIILEYDKKVYK